MGQIQEEHELCSRWRGEYQSNRRKSKKVPHKISASLQKCLPFNSPLLGQWYNAQDCTTEGGVPNPRETENLDGRKRKLSQKIPQLISLLKYSCKKLWILA